MKQLGKFTRIIQSPTPVLVDFYADWCGPCKAMTPILSELKAKMGNDVKIIKVDVDRNPQLAAQYQIRGVPTLMLFQRGKVRWRQSGVVPLPQLVQQLQTNAASKKG